MEDSAIESNKSLAEGQPTVSVCLITFQHAEFVREAIESILAQKTNFAFEILIGEDGSSDGTREICEEYASQHPDKIRLFRRRREDVICINGRPTGRFNFMSTMAEASGKYLALLEGDDFWTDPQKLQYQVDYLESHPSSSACFHQVNRIEEGKVVDEFTVDAKEEYHTEDLLSKTMHHTSSLVMRNFPWLSEMPEWHRDVLLMDRLLAIWLSHEGALGFIPRTMSHYRLHSGGIFTGVSYLRRVQDYSLMYASYLRNLKGLNPSSRKRIKKLFRKYHLQLLKSSIRMCKFREFLSGLRLLPVLFVK